MCEDLLLLSCCNCDYRGSFFYIISNTPYHTIEYGICPVCGVEKFRDYKQYSNGIERVKDFKGLAATDEYLKWRGLIKAIKKDAFFGNDICYGEGYKSNKKDHAGNPIYKQKRKNFFNQSEIIGEVKTLIYNN